MGFRILNRQFTLDKHWDPTVRSFFCSGGLNALTRKNIDKIIQAFKELEAGGRLGAFKLYVYIQGVEVPPHIERYRSSNIIFNVCQRSYHEIVELYKKHDIFIHMGDHEGLGLGFYESITCGTPVFTIDTPPNNEIIHEGVNGWLVRCNYVPLNDNPQGITKQAKIEVNDLKNKFIEIMSTYDRQKMLQSTVTDYMNRYSVQEYVEQIKKIFS
jgi:glycosyltransferase involved in cell wall biosynthesis